MIQLTVTTPDGEHVFPIEVDGATQFADIKAICEAETGLASASFVLLHNGKPVVDSQTPATAGIQPGDMLVLVQPQQQRQQQQQGRGGQGAVLERNNDGSLVNPAAAIGAMKEDRNMMSTFQQQAPRLYDAIMADDVAALQEELRRAHRAQYDANSELERLHAMQEEDPFNPELQTQIEEAIRRKNIDENYEAAMEHNPEAKMKVADQVVTTSITVLEQKSGPQFIFGLDMLRRHQCCVDLAKGVLRVGSCNVELPFLVESQIPTDFSAHVEDVSEAEANRRMQSDAAGTRDKMETDSPAPSPAPAPAPAAAAAPPPPVAAAPPPPAAARPPAPASAASAASAAEAAIAQLMALGADRATAEQALQAAGGNVDAAAGFMFDITGEVP
ncbi:DNA damage-inducible protein 1, partial [Tetrabaena socialis]